MQHHWQTGRCFRAIFWLMLALATSFGFAQADIESAQADAATSQSLTRELPPGLHVPDAARPGPGFDAARATDAYIALLTPAQRAKSDAYFEGGYWLQFWGLLYGLVVAWLLLASGAARWMRDRARRITLRPFLSTLLFAAMFIVVSMVLDLPLSLYQDFFREHQYGLATQTLPAWFGDLAKGLGFGLLLGAPLIALLYAALRRAGDRWWVWASFIMFGFIVFVSIVAPVYISPAFNKYEPLAQGELRDDLLSLARANRIPATDVYAFDASKQTTRISANVSGLFGTTRIALNDNLLERTSPPEILAVMGHEMGHYVLNHSTRLIVYSTLTFAFALWLTHLGLSGTLRRWGAKFGIADRADPAGLPLLIAVLSLAMFALTPITNTITRQAEAEADMFGLDSAREPHGFATAAMRLSTYRKIDPGAFEEFWFFTHPSGRDRVRRSMEWLAENQDDPADIAGQDGKPMCDSSCCHLQIVDIALGAAAWSQEVGVQLRVSTRDGLVEIQHGHASDDTFDKRRALDALRGTARQLHPSQQFRHRNGRDPGVAVVRVIA